MLLLWRGVCSIIERDERFADWWAVALKVHEEDSATVSWRELGSELDLLQMELVSSERCVDERGTTDQLETVAVGLPMRCGAFASSVDKIRRNVIATRTHQMRMSLLSRYSPSYTRLWLSASLLHLGRFSCVHTLAKNTRFLSNMNALR